MPPDHVRLTGSLVARVIAAWLLFLWPLLLFGGPAYFPDSTSYFKGGAVAMSVVSRQFADSPASGGRSTRSTADQVVSTVGSNIKGARSATYSVASYLLSGPGARLTPLIVMQALLLAICVVTFLSAVGVEGGRLFWGMLATLTVATPAAWFAAYAMPDIFAGTTILTLALLASPQTGRPMGAAVRVMLIAIAAFGISAHASHIALAAVMIPFLLICLRLNRTAVARPSLAAFGWAGGTVVAAVLVVLATALLGFGELSIAPKRYPLALGRAIEQGPARWYLESACPSRRFQVCTLYPGGIPRTAYDFLWGPAGVSVIATPAQMDRLRDEEGDIVMAAARAYPVATARTITGGLLRQLTDFGPGDLNFDRSVQRISPTEIALSARHQPLAWLAPLALVLTWATVLASVVVCALRLRRMNANFQLACLILFGVVANAAICATFSAVAARYQARVIWLLPLVAIALWVGHAKRPVPEPRRP